MNTDSGDESRLTDAGTFVLSTGSLRASGARRMLVGGLVTGFGLLLLLSLPLTLGLLDLPV